jgi:chaperonin GroES
MSHHHAAGHSQIRPLHDRVLVRREPPETVSKRGIIIPDTAQQKAGIATVVAVGCGRVLADGSVVPPGVKKGDVVYLGKYSLQDVTLNGETLGIIREEEILAVKE